VIDAVSFGVAAVALLLITGGRRHADPSTAAGRPSLLSDIGSGIRAAWADPAVRSIIVLTTTLNFAITGPMSVGLAILADTRFAGGAAAFGLLFSAFGAGAVAGALGAGSIPRPPHLGAVVLTMAVLLGVGLAGIGLAPTLAVALAIHAVMGVLVGFVNVQAIAWLQARIPADRRGRVMSLVTLGSVGLAPVSLALAGFLVDLGLVTQVFVAGGAIVVAASLAGFARGVPGQMLWPEEERSSERGAT
jgi:MFS family permease